MLGCRFWLVIATSFGCTSEHLRLNTAELRRQVLALNDYLLEIGPGWLNRAEKKKEIPPYTCYVGHHKVAVATSATHVVDGDVAWSGSSHLPGLEP